MRLVDANVLLYAVNEAEPRHHQARSWLDGCLSASKTVALAWLPLLAFLRLSTKPDIFPRPLTVDEALSRVRAWLNHPSAVILEPTSRHLDLLAGLLAATGSGGNLTSDAHLAALALQYDATVISYDNDFSRFPGVRWKTPT